MPGRDLPLSALASGKRKHRSRLCIYQYHRPNARPTLQPEPVSREGWIFELKRRFSLSGSKSWKARRIDVPAGQLAQYRVPGRRSCGRDGASNFVWDAELTG